MATAEARTWFFLVLKHFAYKTLNWRWQSAIVIPSGDEARRGKTVGGD